MGVAAGFGMNIRVGLMAGSIFLVEGVGAAVAWAPTLDRRSRDFQRP